MMRVNKAVIAIAAVSVWLGGIAGANVSLQNGNFFIGYKDIVYFGGFEPKLERVYNSKSNYVGMFGIGWGTEFEVYLTPMADGSVLVNEFGGGAENQFVPKGYGKKAVEAAVEKIFAAAKKSGAVGDAEKYKQELRNNSFKRTDEWKVYVQKGLLDPVKLKEGTELVSNRFSFQKIMKIKTGYRRHFDSGKVEVFDETGRLVEIKDKNGNFVKLEYQKDGKILRIVDNLGRKMKFNYNTQGFVASIEGDLKTASYEYSSVGELKKSKDAAGNTYVYSYDSDHNMTEIAYEDKTKLKIGYHGKDKNQNVAFKIERDGTRADYTYVDKGDEFYKASMQVKDKDGNKLSSSGYEYFYRRKENGERWTYRMIEDRDSDKTEYTYNECCGLPVKIKKSGEETNFEYDDKGRVAKKDTPTELVELKYKDQIGKVSRVARFSKLTKQKKWSEFDYDPKGNLKRAWNSDKKNVILVYDGRGRIIAMKDQGQREIRFVYNENSRPVKITDPKLGSITVSYTDNGKIKDVNSSSGRKIALQVTSAFQNLLDVIRPAGVTLSFQ